MEKAEEVVEKAEEVVEKAEEVVEKVVEAEAPQEAKPDDTQDFLQAVDIVHDLDISEDAFMKILGHCSLKTLSGQRHLSVKQSTVVQVIQWRSVWDWRSDSF